VFPDEGLVVPFVLDDLKDVFHGFASLLK
jgi:hypothetical protein